MARDHLDNQGGTGFTVDNGTGLEVRTKLNKVIDALKSLQSGSGDPTTGLGQYQLHVNEISATSQILKIRNKANTGFTEIGDVAQTNLGMLLKAGGIMTGVLQLTSGSKAAPALNFGDTSTGFYRTGSNIIGVTANGDKKVVFKTAGTEFFGNDTAGAIIRLRESNNNNATQYVQLKAPASISSNVTLTLPSTNPPVANYALIATNTNGTLGWGVAGGASGGGTNQVFWENDQAVTTDYSITNGKNAGSFGPITINSGVTVTVGSGETWSVV